MNLFQYLLHRPIWHRLPPMPRQWSSEYNGREVDHDVSTLMSMTHTRSPQGVKLLLKKHQVETPRELITLLPPRRRKRHILRRALALLRRAEGVTPYNPMVKIARQHIRRGRR